MSNDLMHNPIFPDHEPLLAEQLRCGDMFWKELSEIDQHRLRNGRLQAKCPACGNKYDVWDGRRSRVKTFCSNECSIKARRTKNWECDICKKRFKGDWGLQTHLTLMHPKIDEHTYVRKYWESKGRDVTKLQRYCGVCRKERMLNFKRAHYNECPCVNTERKLIRLEKQLAAAASSKEKVKLGNQIGGTRSLLTKLRSASPEFETQQKSRSKVLHCSNIELLYELGGHFSAMLKANYDVYDRYYSLQEHRRGTPPTPISKVKHTNDQLLGALKENGWKSGCRETGKLFLYVWVLNPEHLKDGGQHPEIYHKSALIADATIDELRGSLRYDSSLVSKELNRIGSVAFPLASTIDESCWHAFLIETAEGPRFTLNPSTLMQIHRSLARCSNSSP